MPVWDDDDYDDYDYNHNYFEQQECSWTIAVDCRYRIRITIDESTIGGAHPWLGEYVQVRTIIMSRVKQKVPLAEL